LLLALQIFPMILVLIPLFIFFVNLGLLNTRLSLIILYTAICIPYPVWMFKAYFDSIGRELEEAAWIDGCSRPQAFARVVIPLTWPGVIAVAIFSFILCWNEFMMANLFLRKDELKTLPVAIRSFIAAETTNWGQMMAAATIALIPVFILFVFFQRFMIAGYTEGGTKE
jgi:ABC-type glycerol-3-phosphate transport system permease component